MSTVSSTSSTAATTASTSTTSTTAATTTGNSVGTGKVSSSGIGSGLDVDSIVTKLMSVEKIPLTQLQNKATSIQTTISAFGAVQSALSSFRDAARSLASPTTWAQMKATSGDTSAVGVSTSGSASPANYAITTTNLAAAQSTVSAIYAKATTLVGAGSLHLDLAGTGGFVDPSVTGVDVTTTATDTLQSLVDKINSASAGVSASIVTDTTGARLVLTSSKTGIENRFRAAGTGGLAGLSFDPRSSSSGTTTLTQPAADAHATINGLAVSSATNTLESVVPGVVFNLLKPSATAVQVSVAPDTESLKKTVSGFADAYNALATLLATDVKYDSATSTAGPLQADSTAVALQRQLRGILGSASTASSTFSTLSAIGLQVQTDGTVKVNDAALSNAAANPTELKKMMTATSGSSVNAGWGFAQQFRTLGDAAMGATGALTTRVAGLGKSLTANQSDQSKMQDRLDQTEARIRAQYQALDTKMASITGLGSYISQQITNWNKST